jgi:hypothetical protein
MVQDSLCQYSGRAAFFADRFKPDLSKLRRRRRPNDKNGPCVPGNVLSRQPGHRFRHGFYGAWTRDDQSAMVAGVFKGMPKLFLVHKLESQYRN